ncbi:uncharacterized protein N7459_000245 [Penicillium hispanicum]|uniref:uncharacterized protein n=1 Tax=Penicillium hispanicum TaxID=1080232 RepID=UPI00253FE2C5|nr:uncharacterized protein N7459_000245 [Penicillium hispanicum]KAJ5594037.1 hypothetical protein N7459_000245 [Penicillium hispanicum]
MIPSRLQPLLVIVGLVVGSVARTDPEDRDPKDLVASELLEMIPAGKKGSCADEPMDQTLQDAAQLAQNAVDAIDKLLTSTLERNDENIKILNMAYISFGVRYDVANACEFPELDEASLPFVITDGHQRLNIAHYNFVVAAGRLRMDEQLLKMECGDEDMRKVTTLGDLGIEPKDKTIKAYNEEVDPSKKITDQDVVGYYLLQYFSPQVKPNVYDMKTVVLASSDKPRTFALSSPCQGSGGGYFSDVTMIMLCRDKFKLKSLDQAIQDQDEITETSDLDKALDNQETPSTTFLHEVMHWVNDRSMWTSDVGKKPELIMRILVTDVAFRPPGYQQQVTAYRTKFCRLLAFDKEEMDETVVNADSYKMFAKGVTLNKINWYPKGYSENVGV